MWHCRQAVICLINIFKRGTMMALIIISLYWSILRPFIFPPFDCHSSKTQPKAASAVPLRLHTHRKTESRSPQRQPRPQWSAGLFHFYGIFVFIVEDSREGMGLDLFETGWIWTCIHGRNTPLISASIIFKWKFIDTYLGLTDLMVKILKLHFECHSVCVVVQVVFNLTQFDFS